MEFREKTRSEPASFDRVSWAEYTLAEATFPADSIAELRVPRRADCVKAG
jgi:hypothetical protein